jgi:8-oxo-dGTP pyrophosphatase MutT (NUDIX family)
MFCNRAVCGLIEKNGLFLVVSRRNSEQWGLIGGKVDEGETEEEALKRELLEEGNIKISKFVPIYSNICPGNSKDVSYLTTTYLIYGDINFEEISEVEEGIIPMWKSIEDFENCEYNLFKEYNLEVLKNYKLLFENKTSLKLN